jgi:hypothetical protein
VIYDRLAVRRCLPDNLSGQPDYFGLALVVSIVGVLLSGFNADSFRFFGYWISLGAAWAYISKTNSQSFNTIKAQAD